MSDRNAVYLGAVIIGALLLDLGLNGAAGSLFLIRKLADLIYFVSFWRH